MESDKLEFESNNDYGLGPLHSKLLKMMEWFHNFCVEHGLKYFAIGGTLLGAIRHKGFIPWDDDVDIGMPRPDYNKFIELSKNNASVYVSETIYDGDKSFKSKFCKLYDTTTTVIYSSKFKVARGLFLDIFPLDGVGNTKKEALKTYKKIRFRSRLIGTKIYKLYKSETLIQKIGIVLGKIFPYNWRRGIKNLNKFCAKKNYYDYEYIMNPFGIWRTNEIVKREWMGEPELYDFESIQIFGPQDADKYLTSIYGNYMQLPPEEKRIPHHDYLYMDLNKSYLEYKQEEK